MDDEATGVRYVKKVIPEKQLSHLQKNSSFSDKPSIRGVCAGDFDGDERPDIFFAYPYGGHRLFRNLGGFRFRDVTEKTGLSETVANHWAVGC
ncbi:MAG: VCBS repeat-containing protein, partial [Opitutales bacterium]